MLAEYKCVTGKFVIPRRAANAQQNYKLGLFHMYYMQGKITYSNKI